MHKSWLTVRGIWLQSGPLRPPGHSQLKSFPWSIQRCPSGHGLLAQKSTWNKREKWKKNPKPKQKPTRRQSPSKSKHIEKAPTSLRIQKFIWLPSAASNTQHDGAGFSPLICKHCIYHIVYAYVATAWLNSINMHAYHLPWQQLEKLVPQWNTLAFVGEHSEEHILQVLGTKAKYWRIWNTLTFVTHFEIKLKKLL